ncbi:MAG: 2-C-methyl-D-erythritol 4-phosphate cytidylyltransferase [Desulfobacteraceae bacterium IS3]|nr:MAG: 2-C-methyl-D-erythritol 4-phosphate cytidylyltransferase [Desulfobacteraceae bacterium IS3]
MPVSAIIVAGGKGIRMGGAVRKQYMTLGERPVLGHTLAVFDAHEEIDKIFLVIPKDDFDFCREILSSLRLQKEATLVPGGAARQDSVYNGLSAANDTGGIVLIHDGVRPFVSAEQITACISSARECGACILGIPVHDTLKQIKHNDYIEKTLDRETVWLAQTPQAFQYDLIRNAYKIAKKEGYTGTDDASLLERLGKKVKIISGSRYNIKITTREDMKLAKAILEFFQ